MKRTLLLRIAAPMQSWGVAGKFEQRTTAAEPTKSGVLGMLAAALGRKRNEDITDLAELDFGVRIDQGGKLIRDYQTVKYIRDNFEKPYGTHVDQGKCQLTERFYLADAVFLVALEGEAELIEQLNEAVQSPMYPLFLGRRSCPPTGRISLGVVDMSLEEALRTTDWQASKWYIEKLRRERGVSYKKAKVLLVLESNFGIGQQRRDVPVSYSWTHRKHDYRYVVDTSVTVGEIHRTSTEEVTETEHDVFAACGGDA